MTITPMREIIQLLCGTDSAVGSQPTDKELLESFVYRQDTAALAALVRRHSSMVWGVCRRILHRHHDAEDAYQATFLVFVRKAAAIRDKERLANWLYGVACQTATKARAIVNRRSEREKQVLQMPEPVIAENAVLDDLRPLIDREMRALPSKYRLLLILCDLEGRTRKEVARQLDCPEGTVAGRLARARTMLARRLTRRGVTVCGSALAAALSAEAASARISSMVISTTIKATSLFASGQTASTVASAKVVSLAESVLKSMLFSKLKLASAFLLLISAVVSSGLVVNARQRVGSGDNSTVVVRQENDSVNKKTWSKSKRVIDTTKATVLTKNNSEGNVSSDIPKPPVQSPAPKAPVVSTDASKPPVQPPTPKAPTIWFNSTGASVTLTNGEGKVTGLPSDPIVGSGKPVTKAYDLKDFTSVEVRGPFAVVLKQDKGFKITVTTDDNLFDHFHLQVEKDGTKLAIGLKEMKGDPWFSSQLGLGVTISLPTLEDLRLNGSTRATLDGFTFARRVRIYLNGACQLEGSIRADDRLIVEMSGTCSLALKGTAKTGGLKANGICQLALAEVTLNSADVTLTGQSRAFVCVKEKLDYALLGISHLEYFGNPNIGTRFQDGMSSVVSKN